MLGWATKIKRTYSSCKSNEDSSRGRTVPLEGIKLGSNPKSSSQVSGVTKLHNTRLGKEDLIIWLDSKRLLGEIPEPHPYKLCIYV